MALNLYKEMGWDKTGIPRKVIEAVLENVGAGKSRSGETYSMTQAEWEDYQRAKKEHAPGVTVRMENFRVVYRDKDGRIVSSHV